MRCGEVTVIKYHEATSTMWSNAFLQNNSLLRFYYMPGDGGVNEGGGRGNMKQVVVFNIQVL